MRFPSFIPPDAERSLIDYARAVAGLLTGSSGRIRFVLRSPNRMSW